MDTCRGIPGHPHPHGEVSRAKRVGCWRETLLEPASGNRRGWTGEGLDTAACGAHKESASKDKHGHPSASRTKAGQGPGPQTLQPPGSPQTPSAAWLGVRRAAGRQGAGGEGCSLSRTPFLPKEREGASGGPRHSAPQAGICLLWSLLPKAAGSSGAAPGPGLPSGCPGSWVPSRALAGWALWTLLTAGGRQGQTDQSVGANILNGLDSCFQELRPAGTKITAS